MSCHVIALKDVFSNTSDPLYFFQSRTHTLALKALLESPEDTRNIRVMVGDAGMGKTMLLRSILQRQQTSTFAVHLFWTQLGPSEFLHYFLHELGVSRPAPDVQEAQEQLTRVLEQKFSKRQQVAVLIDEAHELEIPVLQGLAELLDCDLARSKQLQIVLAGLPSLRAKLASPPLQSISDRISAIASLTPFTPEESASYIRRRLEVSGYGSGGRFTNEAIAVIAEIGEGVPTQINNICFEVIYRAEQRGRNRIDASDVLECATQEGGMKAQITQDLPAVVRICSEAFDQQRQSSAAIHTAVATDPTEPGLLRDDQYAGYDAMPMSDATALSKRISDWFGYERLAWSGTIGELATSLQQNEAEVTQTLRVSADALWTLGLGVSIGTTSVSLRALEGRKNNNAEPTQSAPMLSTSEPELGASQVAEHPEPGSSENEFNHSERRDETADASRPENDTAANINGLPEVAAPSPLEEILANDRHHLPAHFEEILDDDRSHLPDHFEEILDEGRSSRFSWIAVLVLFCVATIVFVYAVRHYRLLNRHDSVNPSSQQTIPAASDTTLVPRENSAAKSANENANTASRGKPEPGHVSNLQGAAAAQLLQAARSGDRNAQFELGTAYLRGDGIAADAVAGYTWLTLAFANGNKEAEALLRENARMLGAADIGRVRWNLGEMYAGGVGVPPDKVTAYMWYLLAEVAGEARSRAAELELDQTMTPEQKSEAQARASDWLKKHQQPSTR